MKHVVIIADGAADKPLEHLDGRTPLEAARTPNLDRLAAMGVLGTAVTTPPGFEAGSDVCSMSLLGYNPSEYHTGRAPLEAAALGLDLGSRDWIFRLNFVTVGDALFGDAGDRGLMLDHSAGAVSNGEAAELADALMAHWRSELPGLAADFTLTPGVSYRNILVDLSGKRSYQRVRTVPPHEIPRCPWVEHLPRATEQSAESAAGAIMALMESAAQFLPSHPVNRARVAAGKRPANAAWIWGQGTRPQMPSFRSRFGLSGAMITAVDLLAGIAALMEWRRVHCPGITSYHDTDYVEQGRVTCNAIEHHDIVCCHVESPDEASHQGDWNTKIAAIEAIDRHVVGPIVGHLASRHGEGWRVLIMPDHYTLISTRKHDATPPPWLIAGSDVPASGGGRFTEASASRGRRVDPGDALMSLFVSGRANDLM